MHKANALRGKRLPALLDLPGLVFLLGDFARPPQLIVKALDLRRCQFGELCCTESRL